MRLLDALFDSVLDIWTGVTQDDDTTIILGNRARVTGPVKTAAEPDSVFNNHFAIETANDTGLMRQ